MAAISSEAYEFDENIPSTSSLGAQMLLGSNLLEEEVETIEDAEDDYWTVSELLKELTRAYLNEVAAPKLLPEKLDLVDKLLLHSSEMERMMERNANKQNITYSAHKMELCRIEFIVNSYIRTRLKKIEQNPAKTLHEHSERLRQALAAFRTGKPTEQQAELLDLRELRFTQDLQRADSSVFAEQFLKQLPASMQWMPLPWGNSANQDRVFVEVLREGLEPIPVPNMADPNSEVLLSLEKGTRHLLPFSCIRELLERGDVCLL